MSKNKIYVLSADMTGIYSDALSKRDCLGKEIVRLAQQAGETVWFHDYKEPMLGAPLVFLECSEAFITQLKKLAECRNCDGLGSDVKTERSASIQAYFETPPKKGSGPSHLPPSP